MYSLDGDLLNEWWFTKRFGRFLFIVFFSFFFLVLQAAGAQTLDPKVSFNVF
jgi:hypothetical protein